MKKHFNKSTPEQVKEYKRLRKQGMSYVRIGKLFKKDHTAIMWWCGDIKKKAHYFKFKEPKKKVKTIKELREELGVRDGMDYSGYLKREASKKNADSIYMAWLPKNRAVDKWQK